MTCPTIRAIVTAYAARVAARTAHDPQCAYHCDQNEWECSCGLTQPRAEWFVAAKDDQA